MPGIEVSGGVEAKPVEHTFNVEQISERAYPGLKVAGTGKKLTAFLATLNTPNAGAGQIEVQVLRNAEILDTVIVKEGELAEAGYAQELDNGDALSINIVAHSGESPNSSLSYTFVTSA